MTISWEVKVKMRQVYESPKMFVQEFVPNEYVAACGDVNKIYRFVCNAGTYDTLLGYDVYTNGEDGKPGTWDDVYLGGYTPCDATHDASTTDEFIEGYMRKDYGLIGGSKIDVISGEAQMEKIFTAQPTLTKMSGKRKILTLRLQITIL